MNEIHRFVARIREMDLHSNRELSPATSWEMERRRRDLCNVMRTITGVEEEAHLGYECRHVRSLLGSPHVHHPLVTCSVLPSVHRNPLGDVPNHNPATYKLCNFANQVIHVTKTSVPWSPSPKSHLPPPGPPLTYHLYQCFLYQCGPRGQSLRSFKENTEEKIKFKWTAYHTIVENLSVWKWRMAIAFHSTIVLYKL